MFRMAQPVVFAESLVEAFEKDEFTFPPLTKWCYLVVGVEGNGNYMLRNALIAAGCYHEAKLDAIRPNPYDYQFANMPDKLAFHRSVPHAGHYDNLPALIACLSDAGYRVHLIGISRDPNAATRSIQRRSGTTYIDAANHRYPQMITDALDWTDAYTPITYEAFVTSEGFRRWLFEERLGLPYPEDFEVRNENEKYYD